MSSYHAELGGLLALFYIVYRICKYHNISAGIFRVYCDNKFALSKVTTAAPRGITPFLTSDYDLVALLQLYYTLLPITVVGEWVKGHYSGGHRKYKHDLNDHADYLATTAHWHMPRTFATAPIVSALPGTGFV